MLRAFPHNEPRYYLFGLRAGLTNLTVNGWRLGVKKTLGKVSQPINAASRFPEYFCFDSAIREFLENRRDPSPARILDVGSPKLLGLYLGYSLPVEICLTDISELNIDEYRVMWRGLDPKAKGRASFSLEDARSLRFPDASFDIVYSMSVIEHVEGEHSDSTAVRELLRVLKPGGLLVMSVPFGQTYQIQQRIGFAGAARRTEDQREYFFQRIYNANALQSQVLEPAADRLASTELTTVGRRNQALARGFGALGDNLRGALGFLNPLLSVAVNTTSRGINPSFRTSYGAIHSASDVYGDVILAGIKR